MNFILSETWAGCIIFDSNDEGIHKLDKVIEELDSPDKVAQQYAWFVNTIPFSVQPRLVYWIQNERFFKVWILKTSIQLLEVKWLTSMPDTDLSHILSKDIEAQLKETVNVSRSIEFYSPNI